MDSTLDFGQLSGDESLKTKILDFKRDTENAEKMLEEFFTKINYDQLSVEDKVRYDLFLAYAINTFYWMYLRTQGLDPNQHDIKSQINRVRDYMNRSKQIYEKKTLMPRVNQGAAKRFIRSGLWEPATSGSTSDDTPTPSAKKRKRDDDGDDDDVEEN